MEEEREAEREEEREAERGKGVLGMEGKKRCLKGGQKRR